MTKNFKGYLSGITTSVTFGLIPLFTIPLMNKGMHYDSILFWRFFFASIALAGMLKATGQSFKIEKRDIPTIVLLGAFYTGSSLFLLWGYEFMGAGLATAMHFTYPVFVTLFMAILFREKTSPITWTAILLAVAGVGVLSVGGDDTLSLKGVVIVLISAVAYASYITAVNKSRVSNMNGRKLAFYVFVVSTALFGLKTTFSGGLETVPDPLSYVNVILLAVLPTVISNITLLISVRNIGGTMTSVLGAMEPVTAVAVGTIIFGEPFTFKDAAGVAMIIIAVTIIILSGNITRTFSSIFKRIRPRHA